MHIHLSIKKKVIQHRQVLLVSIVDGVDVFPLSDIAMKTSSVIRLYTVSNVTPHCVKQSDSNRHCPHAHLDGIQSKRRMQRKRKGKGMLLWRVKIMTRFCFL